MKDFPKFEYSDRQVLEAGKALAGDLIWTDDDADRIRDVFRIANNWRDTHALPMRKMRFELMGFIRSGKMKGFTAARLKRMRSIRKKLKKLPLKLNNIQDLGACRAVVPEIADVDTLVAKLRQDSKHDLHSENDYINSPKSDGYRCHHMVFKFVGADEDASYNGRRIELQVRTRLQHSWATAVEAVGLFRREDMKGGTGDEDWLRLFKLMSTEFALAERCAEPEGSGRDARVKEIIALESKLSAASMLEKLRQAVRYTESYVTDVNNKPDYYLIKYSHEDNTVTVDPYTSPLVGVKSYDIAEASDNKSGKNKIGRAHV